MADNSNTTPNNDNGNNPIDPNKKRYILPTSKSSQDSTTTPYPPSLNSKGDNKPNLAQQLRAKFARPEPIKEEPKPIPITLQNEENIVASIPSQESPKIDTPVATNNFRYEENKQEFALPVAETPKDNPEPIKETVKTEEPKPQAIPINLGNETQSIAEPIASKQEPKIEPVIQAVVEPIVEPRIEKIETNVTPKINVNPLPTEIETGAKQAVAESKKAESPTIELTKPEEPVNKVDDVKKYTLPGPDTDNDFRTESDRIRAEITSKFAPKVEETKLEEAKAEDTKPSQNPLENLIEKIDEKVEKLISNIEVPEVVKETVVIEAPKIVAPTLGATMSINPLPPEIESVVKESQIPDLNKQGEVENTEPKEVVNKFVKNDKYPLPGLGSSKSDYQTTSEEIRDKITAKFRPKVETDQNAAESVASDQPPNPEFEEVAAATVAPIIAPNILSGIRPLTKLSEDEPTSTSDIQDENNIETDTDGPVSATEFLKKQAEGKEPPKYQLPQDTRSQKQPSPIIESAAIAAGAIGSVGIGTRVDTNSDDRIDDRIQDVQESQSTGTLNSQSGISRIRSNQGGSTGSVTNYGTSQFTDPNRYISSPQTTSGGRTQTTQTTITTTISDIATGVIIKFNLSRQSFRSANRGSNSGGKKRRLNAAKAGLIALAAALTLNQGGAIAQESGIFDGVNSDGYAIGTQEVKPNTNFITDLENVGPKYQPIISPDEFGQKQGTYDADGKFTEAPKTITDPSDPNYSKPKKPKATNTEDGIPALGSNKPDEQGFADPGTYDEDNNLKIPLLSGDAVKQNQVNRPKQQVLDDNGNAIPQLTQEQRETNAINNAPGAISTGAPAGGIPGQQSPQGGPAVPAPTNDASQIASSADENNGAELNSAKKENLGDKIRAAITGVFTKQAIVLLSLILLTLVMILGIALGAGYYFMAGICSNGGVLNLALAGGLAGNKGSETLYKACEAFTAFTGIGCNSNPDTASGNGECISDYLDATGDTVNMTGYKGDTKAKKSVIKDLITLGKKAASNRNEDVQMMVAVYAAITTEKGFATKNGNCLGFFNLCGTEYTKYTEGLGVKDEGDFLNSKEKQVAAFVKKYNDLIPKIDQLPQCAKDGFKNNFGDNLKGVKKIEKNSPEYKKLYIFLHTGDKKCPDDLDPGGVKYTDYVEAATRNYIATNCNKFKERITTASIDNTYYHQVANSLSSIGSYIGNGLNKFNLNLSITAKASIGPEAVDFQGGQKGGYASTDLQNELISLINNGKIKLVLSSKAEYIGDIQGKNISIGQRVFGNQKRNFKDATPPHTNTAKFIIAMANSQPGLTMSALGNNTHRDTPGWHNTNPLLAVDFSSTAGGPSGPDYESDESMKKFLQAAASTGLVLQVLFAGSYNKAKRLAQGMDLNVDRESAPNHYHFSIKKSSVPGTPSGLTANCPVVNASAKPTKANTETRLNKKSLSDDQWIKEAAKFPSEPEFGDALQKSIDFQTQDMTFGLKDRMKLFDNDSATNKIYELAEGSGYQYRNRAVIGTGDNDLNGKGPYATKKKAYTALKSLIAAMTVDGIPAKHGESYEEPTTTRTKLQQAILKACNNCTVADIISGNQDSKIQEVFKTQNVPHMTLLSTGHVAQIIDTEISDPAKFNSSKTYKYFTEDNELNLKRFGFTFAYPAETTKREPLQRPNFIIYLGREVLEKGTDGI
jgi:hypothetical protein